MPVKPIVLGEDRPPLSQTVALQGKDAFLSEHHGLVKYRPVLEAEYHPALGHSALRSLEEITRRNGHAGNGAKH